MTMNFVKEQVWAGSINTRILYGQHEYILKLHRSAYLPLYYEEIAQFFSLICLDKLLQATPVWLLDGETPLKWNIPIGVLHDIFYLPNRSSRDPWTLCLRVSCADTMYPVEDLLPFPKFTMGQRINYTETVFQVIINQLKQSCYVLKGNSRAILAMSEDDTKSLWTAIQKHDYDKYHSTMRRTSLDSEAPRRIPIRAYTPGSHNALLLSIAPLKDDGSSITLGEALASVNMAIDKKIYIQGVDVDTMLQQELLLVWRLLRHLDNFLYILLL